MKREWKLKRIFTLLPPNMAAERVHDWILWSLIAPALVCALAFLCRYREAYDALWYSSYSPHAGELLGSVLMQPFAVCVLWTLIVYPMLAAVALWFSCLSAVMTSDKFIYLFGRVIPALSLLLSMILSHSRWRRRPLPPSRRATYHPPPSVDRTRHTGCISSIAQAMTRAK